MTTFEIPDYEQAFLAAVATFWQTREAQAQRQRDKGRVDAGTRGSVTGGKHLDGVGDLIGEVMVNAGISRPRPGYLPGYYRRSKNWDLVGMYGDSIAAIIELKSQVGSFGNNANNRIEEMIGQAVDLWKANREDLLGPTPPWFGYVALIEDCPDSRSVSPGRRTLPGFPPDPIFSGTDLLGRYAIALGRLRQEREIDQVCVVAITRDGGVWYPDPTMTFQTFATSLHAHGLTLRSQLGPPQQPGTLDL